MDIDQMARGKPRGIGARQGVLRHVGSGLRKSIGRHVPQGFQRLLLVDLHLDQRCTVAYQGAKRVDDSLLRHDWAHEDIRVALGLKSRTAPACFDAIFQDRIFLD
ncbi:hypothetical protein A8B83_08860 [Rhodobacteraceae bacterium EhC02]|nr:hypothetical protein A8B83_08860 [Rhodobacteraceae bacterium EhC02]